MLSKVQSQALEIVAIRDRIKELQHEDRQIVTEHKAFAEHAKKLEWEREQLRGRNESQARIIQDYADKLSALQRELESEVYRRTTTASAHSLSMEQMNHRLIKTQEAYDTVQAELREVQERLDIKSGAIRALHRSLEELLDG